MEVKERVLVSSLLLRMSEIPECAKKAGLVDVSYFKVDAGNSKKAHLLKARES